MVLFDAGSTVLSPRGEFLLDNAAEYFRACAYSGLTIAGHADRSGSAAYNLRLSRLRAENVRAYLARRGVPESAMVVEAYGESQPIETAVNGLHEPQNRSVAISFGPSDSLSGRIPPKSPLTTLSVKIV